MRVRWEWPGARWWRCDLHAHSPGSHDFADRDVGPDGWVDSALTTGVEVVAVTDHNSAEFVDPVLAEPRTSSGGIVAVAGVEITSAEGVHLLALLPSGDADAVKALLGACGVKPTDWGKDDARADLRYLDCLSTANDHGALCIAPHADAIPTEGNPCKASLLVGITDNAHLSRVLGSPHLLAAEVVTSDSGRHEKLRAIGRGRLAPGLSLVRFSDAHALEELGRRSTWIKMTRPDSDGLRLAFSDGERSVQEHVGDAVPNEPPALAVESIAIRDARVVGRSGPLEVLFNPWFNAIIGGRGTGKSTVVEMLRLALDRGEELPPVIARRFEDFARIYQTREERGALTDSTRVVVIFRKEGTRFRVTWAPDEAAVLEEETEAGWERAEGSVQQRLPIQIYSQNELHEIAQDPSALLSIVDASSEVDRRGWSDDHGSELARFLALRAQARQLSAGLEREEDLRGELADVNRKLEIFESAEHRAVLDEYQRRRRQARAVARWTETASSLSADLRSAADELEIEPLDDAHFDPAENVDRSVLDLAESTREAVAAEHANVMSAAAQVEDAATEFVGASEETPWSRAVADAESAYKDLVDQLQAAGVGDPEEFGKLVTRREELDERLGELEAVKAELDAREAEATESLNRLAELRTDLSSRRERFLSTVLEGNELVQVDLLRFGDREAAIETFRELLGLEGSFEEDLTKLVAKIFVSDGGADASLSLVKQEIRAVAEGDGVAYEPRDRRFLTRLQRLSPEALDRLDAWYPEDRLKAKFAGVDGSFKPLDQGSAGEKNAAILAFLLSYGKEPIVLDQPENDLDNRLITSLVVASILECKRARQLIIVTHNPNVVVNGDAELMISLGLPAGEVVIERSGGLQERGVREEICDVIEGGQEAFELRYSRIGQQSSAEAR